MTKIRREGGDSKGRKGDEHLKYKDDAERDFFIIIIMIITARSISSKLFQARSRRSTPEFK